MTEQTEQAAKPSFVGDRPREKRISLEWPVAYDGKTYSAITLRRLTVAEVSDFIESLDGETKLRVPMFFDDDGAAIPAAVMAALDDDDAAEIDEASVAFLPRRFRAAPEKTTETASAPSAGEAIAPSSNG
jgi:hypothetical protein